MSVSDVTCPCQKGQPHLCNQHNSTLLQPREPRFVLGPPLPAKLITPVKKDTNPKDAVGVRKVPFSTVPARVVAEVGLAMLEGSRKYGRHNYRVAGVRASVYYDALLRHMTAWWEGEDIDPESGISHVVKAAACLFVLRDAMTNDKLTDDRPPSLQNGWQTELNKLAGELIDRHPNPKDAYTK